MGPVRTGASRVEATVGGCACGRIAPVASKNARGSLPSLEFSLSRVPPARCLCLRPSFSRVPCLLRRPQPVRLFLPNVQKMGIWIHPDTWRLTSCILSFKLHPRVFMRRRCFVCATAERTRKNAPARKSHEAQKGR